MYEDQTKAEILERMLGASPADIDKRQGSVTFDLLSPAAIELTLAYSELDNVLAFGFADTTYGNYLDMRAKEYGLTRKPAVKAAGSLTFSGPAGTVISRGTLSSTGGDNPVYFVTTTETTITGGSVTVAAEAQDAGAAGNVGAGEITTLLGDLVGIVTVTSAAYFEGGVDAESDASLLARYYERAQRPATSGNANQYRQWALEVPGVSDARVYPVWNGPGTVKIVLLDDDKTAPDPSVVSAAQTYIDPTQDGTGQGVAPIGAAVTIAGAVEVPVNIAVKVTLAPGATVAEVRAQIETGVRAYLRSLAFADPLVRITRIANVILDIPPVIDYENLTLNGTAGNTAIADGEVAVLGGVVVTAA
ncbi:putative phage protein gp47/JayE [Fontibacillus phaseoli]|uniref:Putative phage protein gp47/JayE n=1 Tax=Fontibacillus phaseoli TaxID=1416533 RepID=A0A369BQU1_9BACL|nr:baseplate J/gp47 family protein [Fontibacillus phaseoli]RCX22966.1 putative phage protein gp47/JayE [Fontibacillus phaseoli]